MSRKERPAVLLTCTLSFGNGNTRACTASCPDPSLFSEKELQKIESSSPLPALCRNSFGSCSESHHCPEPQVLHGASVCDGTRRVKSTPPALPLNVVSGDLQCHPTDASHLLSEPRVIVSLHKTQHRIYRQTNPELQLDKAMMLH